MLKDTKTRGKSKSRYVRFNLKRSNPKDRPTLILATLRYWIGTKDEKLVYSTKHSIAPNDWNKKERLPESEYKFYKELTEDLSEVKSAIESIYKQFPELPKVEFSKKIDIALGRDEGEHQSQFVGYFDDYLERLELLGTKAKGTITRYRSTLNKVKKYEEKKGVELRILDINKAFHQKFTHFAYSRGTNSPSTLAKDFKIIKMVLEDADVNGLEINKYCKDKKWKIKEQSAPILALDQKQLEKLIKLDLSDNSRLERIRDWFLVSCYTGLAIADWKRIKKDNIMNQRKKRFIKISRQKTKVNVIVPITDACLSILKKYKFKAINISDVKFNLYLKEVAIKAKLNKIIDWSEWDKGDLVETRKKVHEVITSHCGRRTFCTNLYERGIPMMLILQASGHKSESQFLRYIGREQNEQADRLFDLMTGEPVKSAAV